MARKLFIHCGLHKTGTTAVQNTFRTNAKALREVGLLYPETGVPREYSGHHHIAWQLCRDRRFDPECGSLNALFEEVESFKGNVVLSSEDFESSVLYKERWRPLFGKARQAGFQPVLVIYLRDPIEYLESLYLENLKHGFGEEYSAVVRRVCETGKLNLHEWEFCFAYPRIKASLSSLRGIEVIFRNYHSLSGGSAVTDFAGIVGAPTDLLRESRGKKRVNQRDPLAISLGLFLGNRNPQGPRRELGKASLWIVEKMCARLPERLVTPRELRKVMTSFLSGSFGFTEVIADSQMNSGGRDVQAWQRVPAGDDKQSRLNIERIFSFETDVLIRKLVATATKTTAKSKAKDPGKFVAQQIRYWRKWVSEDNAAAGIADFGDKASVKDK